MKSSICIPCNMPYVNNIWLPRRRGDRPPVVPEGATNLGLIGQYVEVEQDIAFTFEYSTRTAWEAIYLLLKRGPAPPPVYQGQFDPKGVWAALGCLSVDERAAAFSGSACSTSASPVTLAWLFYRYCIAELRRADLGAEIGLQEVGLDARSSGKALRAQVHRWPPPPCPPTEKAPPPPWKPAPPSPW